VVLVAEGSRGFLIGLSVETVFLRAAIAGTSAHTISGGSIKCFSEEKCNGIGELWWI